MLFYKDSNLEFQDQNLTCYHYTIEQSTSLLRGRKDRNNILFCITKQTYLLKFNIIERRELRIVNCELFCFLFIIHNS